MNRSISRTTAVVAAFSVLLTVACSARDRAGGRAAEDVVTLSFAQPNAEPPDQLVAFAEQVEKDSHGALTIAFHNLWRAGEPDAATGGRHQGDSIL